jgi:hypothetical protein
MRARHCRTRPGGSKTRRARPSAARAALARLGKTLVLALLLIASTGSASALAANGGASPAPSPEPASTAATSNPTPDPIPGATLTSGSNASSVSVSNASTESSGLAPARTSPSVASTQAPPSTHAPGQAAVPVSASPGSSTHRQASIRSSLHARRLRSRSHHAPARTTVQTVHGVLAGLLQRARRLVGVSGPAAVAASTARHDGVLLLLGAVGLLVLVGASSSLLRFLARMNAEPWEGR